MRREAVLWCLAAGFLFSVGCASFEPVDLRRGLVAEYLFSSSAADSSGSGFDGEAHYVVSTADRFGRPHQAYAFDGMGAYVVVAPPPPLSGEALSVSVWVRYAESTFSWWNNCILAQDGGGHPGPPNRIFQLSTQGRHACWHRMGEMPDLTTTRPVSPGVWYHLVATFDGELHRLYVNGVLNDTKEGPLRRNDTEPFYVARKGTGERGFYFKGIIDDVRLYDRALTPREVTLLYEEEPGPAIVSARPTPRPAEERPGAASVPRAGPSHAPGHVVLRVNSGARTDYVDAEGNTWLADRTFFDGMRWGAVAGRITRREGFSIMGTPDQDIYMTERSGLAAYQFGVPPGSYALRLHFAETFRRIQDEGERVFSVTVNGETVIERLDPLARAGDGATPLVRDAGPVAVSDGTLRVGFHPRIGETEINAIELSVLDAAPADAAALAQELTAPALPPALLASAWTSEDAEGTYCVAWGDYDGDGDPDLAFANKYEGGRNQVYRNDGGTLGLAWTAPARAPSDWVAWGDWDGDGDLDLAVANDGEPNQVWANEGGEFTPAWKSDEIESTMGMVWGDWDADGDLDLAVCNQGQPNRIYDNTGGDLVPAWVSPHEGTDGGVAWGDWDGDGDLDLAAGDFYGAPTRVYETTGRDLVPAWESQERDHSLSVAWGDWDGDGDPDLAVGNAHDEPERVYENTGGGLVLRWTSAELGFTRCVSWGDCDADGDLDLAVANENGPNLLYRNDGEGHLSLAWWSAEIEETIGVAWGDWDGDGDLDLACANKGQNRVYRNLTVPGADEPAPEEPQDD